MSDQDSNGPVEPEQQGDEIPNLGGIHFTPEPEPQHQPDLSAQPVPDPSLQQPVQPLPPEPVVNDPSLQQPSAPQEPTMYDTQPVDVSGQATAQYDPQGSYADQAAPQAFDANGQPVAGGAVPIVGEQPGQSTAPKKANKAVTAGAIAGLVAGLIGGVGGSAVVGNFTNSGGTVATGNQLNPVNPEGLSPRANNSIAAIAEAVTPSVVSIQVTSGSSGGTGTGFIISQDGYIVTNNHVVSSAGSGNGRVTVAFKDETTAEARIVGRSQSYDIAVIKVSKSGLQPVTLGNSANVVVGDAAIAIGSPLGLEGTVTNGIISAVRRPVSAGGRGEASHISALQTDAAINPGNSGGPLVNAEGQVIGVNSSIATMGVTESGTSTSGSIGLGFAIPINNAKRVADEIIATGESKVPIIGVQVDMQTPESGGAIISGVTANEPGAKAGLREGDRIIDIDGDKIADPAEALAVIRSHKPGDTIKVTVQTQSGDTKTVDVTLSAMVG